MSRSNIQVRIHVLTNHHCTTRQFLHVVPSILKSNLAHIWHYSEQCCILQIGATWAKNPLFRYGVSPTQARIIPAQTQSLTLILLKILQKN